MGDDPYRPQPEGFGGASGFEIACVGNHEPPAAPLARGGVEAEQGMEDPGRHLGPAIRPRPLMPLQSARLFLVAGEASGDALGGRLMRALTTLGQGAVGFDGVGGSSMAEAGLASRFPMSELSLRGLAGVRPHLPRLIRRPGELEAAIRAAPPAALVTIDAPAFGLRLQRRIAGLGIPRIHYVAPQVWAWRQGRAKKLARSVDHLLA